MTGGWCLLRIQPMLARTLEHGFCLSQSLEEETSSQWRLVLELAECHFQVFYQLKHVLNLLNFKQVKKEIPSFVEIVSRSCGLCPSLGKTVCCIEACCCCLVTEQCPLFPSPTDCSLLVSFVHGIFQERRRHKRHGINPWVGKIPWSRKHMWFSH